MALPDLLYLHWILNPGLMVNELLLGTRIPKKTIVCERCPDSLGYRSYVHCPACGMIHSAMIWSGSNGFGHWLGLICPDCGARIPSLLNVTSWLVWSMLSPVFWLLWWLFGEKYLAWEKARAVTARERLRAAGLEPFSQLENCDCSDTTSDDQQEFSE
jgi:hypothetical protein